MVHNGIRLQSNIYSSVGGDYNAICNYQINLQGADEVN